MTDTPFRDALAKPIEPSNTAGAGVIGSQRDGLGAGAYVSKDLGKGNVLEASVGVTKATGWGFSAFWRKVWK